MLRIREFYLRALIIIEVVSSIECKIKDLSNCNSFPRLKLDWLLTARHISIITFTSISCNILIFILYFIFKFNYSPQRFVESIETFEGWKGDSCGISNKEVIPFTLVVINFYYSILSHLVIFLRSSQVIFLSSTEQRCKNNCPGIENPIHVAKCFGYLCSNMFSRLQFYHNFLFYLTD